MGNVIDSSNDADKAADVNAAADTVAGTQNADVPTSGIRSTDSATANAPTHHTDGGPTDNLTADTAAALTWFDAHRAQFVDDLLRWVRVPSVSDESKAEPGAPYSRGVAEMFSEAARTAHTYGFGSRDHEGYAMSVFDAAQYLDDSTQSADAGTDPFAGRHDIAMVSHLDVVPAGPGWESDPFEPYERDGYVIGRGADDNKGMALLNLYLLRYYREAGIAFHHPLRVMYGGAEETGLDDMRQYVRHHGAPYQAIITDCGFPVNVAQKGEITVRLTLPRPTSVVGLTAGASANAVPGEAHVIIACESDQTAAQLAAAINERNDQPHDSTVSAASRSATTAGDTVDATDTNDIGNTTTGTVVAVTNGNRVTVTAHGRSGHAAFPDGTVNAVQLLASAMTDTFGQGRSDTARGSESTLQTISGTAGATGRTEDGRYRDGAVEPSSCLFPAYDAVVSLFAALRDWTVDAYGTGFGADYTDAESGRTTVNLGLIETTGDELAMTIDVRHAVTQSPRDVVDRITSAVTKAGGRVLDSEIEPPYAVPRDDPRVTLLTDVYNRIMGTHAEPYAMGGGTHARVIANAINFGPGLPGDDDLARAGKTVPGPDFVHGGAHGPNEWVSAGRLRQAFAIYAAAIPRLDRSLA